VSIIFLTCSPKIPLSIPCCWFDLGYSYCDSSHFPIGQDSVAMIVFISMLQPQTSHFPILLYASELKFGQFEQTRKRLAISDSLAHGIPALTNTIALFAKLDAFSNMLIEFFFLLIFFPTIKMVLVKPFTERFPNCFVWVLAFSYLAIFL